MHITGVHWLKFVGGHIHLMYQLCSRFELLHPSGSEVFFIAASLYPVHVVIKCPEWGSMAVNRPLYTLKTEVAMYTCSVCSCTNHCVSFMARKLTTVRKWQCIYVVYAHALTTVVAVIPEPIQKTFLSAVDGFLRKAWG